MNTRTRFDLSLTILLPLIIAGGAVFALVVTHLVMAPQAVSSTAEGNQLFWMATNVGVCTFIASAIAVRWLLGPMQDFLKKSTKLEVLVPIQPSDETKGTSQPELTHFGNIMAQVTQVLDKLEAQALFPNIVGQSKAMRGVLSQTLKVAPTDATVLLLGESGTGKELFARAIHDHSKRASGPFIAINCAAIPDGLLESELFGHEKGAFTGADARRMGKFEQADGGTLFLDEIGDMPLDTQAKILRAMETGQCERVGGNSPVRFNVRFIAATNRDLSQMMEEKKFREDLYHRLNVFPLQLPPLRARQEDIPLLATRFLDEAGEGCEISSEALQTLMAAPWGGNVRELKNSLARAAVLCGNTCITPAHLSVRIESQNQDIAFQQVESRGLDNWLGDMEKAAIISALTRSGGVQVRAAEILGIKERSLWHRVKKYEVDPTALRGDAASFLAKKASKIEE
ncbi:MAG: sigma-54 interaction domain-containing protein [Desulfovibrio sp.]|uniref:sigma-54 interaction domain-containing protein n=1 Tax=Desulfovibrio sp. 7SRBS1 TaxID=3378064 RepID=UPI003B41D223